MVEYCTLVEKFSLRWCTFCLQTQSRQVFGPGLAPEKRVLRKIIIEFHP